MKEISKEEKDNYLEWSEGNKYLYDLLFACGENEINTFASCGGHDEADTYPYLGIIINDNLMPFLKSILGKLQDMPNIGVSTNVRYSNDGQLLKDEESRAIIFRAYKFNCCELFYKLKEGIECKDGEITLSPKMNKFYESVKRLKETSKEELQEDIDNQMVVGNAFSTITPEYMEYEWSRKLVKNNRILRFLRKMLPFRKNKYEQLAKKYDFLQRDYIGENDQKPHSKMEQYKVDTPIIHPTIQTQDISKGSKDESSKEEEL